jgi:hypothetical protein
VTATKAATVLDLVATYRAADDAAGDAMRALLAAEKDRMSAALQEYAAAAGKLRGTALHEFDAATVLAPDPSP